MSHFHKHHIKPKHMGGSNDPSNIELLTITEHANRHYELWYLCGKQEDYIAWKCLSGQITTYEANILATKLVNTGRIKTQQEIEHHRLVMTGRKHSDETKQKMRVKATGRKQTWDRHGVNHPLYGKKHPNPLACQNSASKTWIIIDPNQNCFEITNLSKFCREHNISIPNILQNKNGSKGYKCKRTDYS